METFARNMSQRMKRFGGKKRWIIYEITCDQYYCGSRKFEYRPVDCVEIGILRGTSSREHFYYSSSVGSLAVGGPGSA